MRGGGGGLRWAGVNISQQGNRNMHPWHGLAGTRHLRIELLVDFRVLRPSDVFSVLWKPWLFLFWMPLYMSERYDRVKSAML